MNQVRRHPPAFALPVVLLTVSAMLALAIGLIAFLMPERQTARSHADIQRAKMAAESALADALATLAPVASRDDSLVFRLEDPVHPHDPASQARPHRREQCFTFGALFDATAKRWRIIPFFSGLPESSSTSEQPDVASLREALSRLSLAQGGQALQILCRPGLHDATVPRARWIEMPTGTHGCRLRFAWWVEDLTGRANGRVAGSVPRSHGQDPAELGIFTWFDPTLHHDARGPEDRLIAKRGSLRTPASVRLVLSRDEAAKAEPFIIYPPVQNPAPPTPPRLIPHGFGYPDAGQPAMDLNKALAARNPDTLASHIQRNLPRFHERKGALAPGENYLKTLAASILDYADPDQNPTTGPDFRGIDSHPFVNELFDRYEWTGTANGSLTIKVATYAELWNPSQQTVTGEVTLVNQNRHEITIPLSGRHSFGDATYGPIRVSLPANGFGVHFLGETLYQFPIGAFPPSQLIFATTTGSSFKLLWNGVNADTAPGGLQRTGGTLNPGPNQRKWKGNGSPAHDESIGQFGDPRASRYIQSWTFANNYDANSSWGGRNLKRDIANPNYREVRPSQWPDHGSDSPPGTKPRHDGELPTSLRYPPAAPTMAPAFISNAGFFTSPAELGRIFDPAQWLDVRDPASPPDGRSGGGFTLAIGRPEFGVFDVEGRRAAQLLDLFDARLPTASHLPKVNINTAPREVLRTLIAGVTLDADPAAGPQIPASTSIVGDWFAEAVIQTRNHRPLRGPSDLALVRKDPSRSRNHRQPEPETEPFFGSREVYPPASRPPASWNDAGREELFRKVLGLVDYQGKSFRIVVLGESLDPAGQPTARAAREIHVSFEPERDTNTGRIVPDGRLRIRRFHDQSL